MESTKTSTPSRTPFFLPSLISIIQRNPSVVLIYGLIFVFGAATAAFSDTFRQPSNLISIFRQSIVLALIAIGQSVVVLAGGMDMSVAMIARIVVMIVASIFHIYSSDSMIFPMIILGLSIGVLLGGVNGVLVTKTHANPFIVTFGVASVLRGISLIISSTPVRGVPSSYMLAYDAKIGSVPVNVIVIALVWFAAWVFTTRVRAGRALFAVGGSERVARLSAVHVNKTLIMAYAISGFCSALAGLFLLSRYSVGDPTTAEGLDFQSIVAVALGGISLYGGKGSMMGTLAGVLLLSMLSNVFNIIQVNIFYQQLLLGLIVLVAVAAYKSPGAK